VRSVLFEEGEALKSSLKVLEKFVYEMVGYILAKKACDIKTNLVEQEVQNRDLFNDVSTAFG